MSEYRQNEQNIESEIDLRELFMALWKRKIMIIGLVLIGGILAGLFSAFMFSPVYDARLNIVINMPEVFNTRYGEYTLPITTNDQYIDLITSNDVLVATIKDMEYDTGKISIESLKNRISIGKIQTKAVDVEQNSFHVTVSADNPQEALKLAQTLYDNYIEFTDVMTKERAINYYINRFNVDIKTQELSLKTMRELLRENEKLLAQTAQTINQKEAVSQVTDTKSFIVLENIINPNYTKVENDIISNKQSISIIEDAIRTDKENLTQLNIEKMAVQKYYETGKSQKLDSTLIGVIETSIYLPSPPVAPTQKTSPNNAKNAVIGLLLGGMLGIMTALIKEYWFKSKV